jgi:hypothetical protein
MVAADAAETRPKDALVARREETPVTRGPLAAAAACLLLLAPQTAGADSAGSSAAAPHEARVVNGVLAQDRPTTGALLSRFGINYQSVCSGTLIGCETFLTAAHCVCEASPFALCGAPSPGDYAVYLQDVGLVEVAAIEVDSTYDFEEQGDVAVLTLATPVTGVAPTPINTDMRPPLGTIAEIAGFGLTRGGAGDTGLLRRGLAETSACTGVEADFHVCWDFTLPIGAAGIDSNTCSGDSGGPLFADLGSGTTVVGITSGGSSADCLPTDSSFDADVYVHSGFISAVGGADLLNTSCGSIAQVGEPGASRATFDFDILGKQAQACRKEVAREYVAYTAAALKAWQRCLDDVNDGDRPGPCPDADTADALAVAAEKASLTRLESKCPDATAATIGSEGLCAGATDAADLQACILSAGNAAVADALASEYADDSPNGAIADAEAADCQRSVAKAGARLLKKTLKAATRCQASLASGRIETCPDAKTLDKTTSAETKLVDAVTGDCSDAAVALLDSTATFGGTCAGETTAAGLAACELADHADVAGGLLALLADQEMETDVSFSVPPGTAVLRVTLNGKDSGSNDLDLYVRAGAPATTVLYDDHSENGGVFEGVEIASPAAGTWHVHIDQYAGETLIPYQLTATSFQP